MVLYVIRIYKLIKIVYATFCAGMIMLISYLSKRSLTAGILSLAVVYLPEIIGFFEKPSAANIGKFLSCNFVSMTNDINYVNVFGSPVKIRLLSERADQHFSVNGGQHGEPLRTEKSLDFIFIGLGRMVVRIHTQAFKRRPIVLHSLQYYGI